MGKNIHGIWVFLEGNLNFTMKVFIFGLANDLYVYKNMKNPQNYHFV